MKGIALTLLIFSSFILENYASAQESTKNVSRVEKATLAGGCFWCLELSLIHIFYYENPFVLKKVIFLYLKSPSHVLSSFPEA